MTITSKKIFIVEDEPDLLDLYIEILELEGNEIVCTARNGAEAITSFQNLQERPDVIIMDHRMPIKNGLEAAKEILDLDPDVKVIFASADQNVMDEALEIGALRFLKKPFDIDALINSILDI